MTARATTEKHRAPTEEHDSQGTPVLLLASPEVRAFPLPELRAPTGRGYFVEGGHLDNEISKEHFALSGPAASFASRNLGSSNGTLIDGHSIAPRSPAPLHDGAVLRLGESLFIFERRSWVRSNRTDLWTGS